MSEHTTPTINHHDRNLKLIFGLCLVILLSAVAYLFIHQTNQADKIVMLMEERNFFLLEQASTTRVLRQEREVAETTISELSQRLSLTSEDLRDIERDLRREKDRNEEFEDQISNLAGTVGDLDKLSRTDRELLQKYSRTYFLNENFIPIKLTQLKDRYIMPGRKDQYFHGDAIHFLDEMIDDARSDGHDLYVISAYRSFDEQQELKGQFMQVYGSGSNAFSADQGFSEHQLGTAVDITDLATGATSQSFANTKSYLWLLDNAHRYGFILSYPEENTFYIFEPWHWRFVGRDLASDLKRKGKSFYDLEQRELDNYLIKIFD